MDLVFAPRQIEVWPIEKLRPYAKNAKIRGAKHSKDEPNYEDLRNITTQPSTMSCSRYRALAPSPMPKACFCPLAIENGWSRLFCRKNVCTFLKPHKFLHPLVL